VKAVESGAPPLLVVEVKLVSPCLSVNRTKVPNRTQEIIFFDGLGWSIDCTPHTYINGNEDERTRYIYFIHPREIVGRNAMQIEESK
jgi:hypothetical protein